MVDLVQEVTWEYKEGPSIGSFTQVAANRSPHRSLRRPADEDNNVTPSVSRRGSINDPLHFTDHNPVPRNTLALRIGYFANRVVEYLTTAVGVDWTLLALLGISTALTGFLLDLAITSLMKLRRTLSEHGSENIDGIESFLIWVTFSAGVASVAVAATHHIAPQGIGSGIPEMKVILKGINLSEYLSLRTLMSKVVGLTFALGSGLPIGKEGPFVHISSIITERLVKNFSIFKSIKMNQARRTEMLAAACAVGVASDFGAPIGGLLFSIEVTSTYFAVRSYWRGFFASVVAAFVFRVLAIFMTDENTITLLFTTNFHVSPFEMWELPIFMILGATCGLLGALFVFASRRIVEFRRKLSERRWTLMDNRYAYTILVSGVIAITSFPGFLGRQMGMSQKTEINHLFEEVPLETLPEWSHGNVFANLLIFASVKFLVVPLAASLPIPAGVFVPVFVLGAAIGRLFGEVMIFIFPSDSPGFQDVNGTSCMNSAYSGIVPGGYAVVGAAAMAGSVTQTISTSVIVFELTGQLHHIIPVMISVLIANVICQKLSPSIYDSIIQMKNLPYIPDLRKGESYNMTALDIMNSSADYISLKCSYKSILNLLSSSNAQVFPLVDTPESRFLIGAVQRNSVEALLDLHTESSAMDDDVDDEFSATESDDSKLLLDSQDDSDHKRLIGNKKNRSPRRRGSSRVLDEPLLKHQSAEHLTTSDDSPAEYDDMEKIIDLSGIPIDPSPFQIVDQTSLYKVHTLFALLGVPIAFVTSRGRLIGSITAYELRRGIEMAGGRRLEARAVPNHPRNRVHFESAS